MHKLKSLIVSSLIAVILLTSCTRSGSGDKEEHGTTPAPNKNEGGQDGGGGHVQISSAEEVRAALKRALELAADRDQVRNLFVTFGISVHDRIYFVPNQIIPNQLLLDQLFPEWQDIVSFGSIYNRPEIYAQKGTLPFETSSLAALGKNRIIYKESGDCGRPQDNHADGSVSSFDLQGEICFSVGNLRRLPPSSLLKEILGLVMHEAVHLGGADEVTAMRWQNQFLDYLSGRFGAFGLITNNTNFIISRVNRLTEFALQVNKTSPNDPRVLLSLKEVVDLTASRLTKLESITVDPAYFPANPGVKNNYVNAVLALLEKVFAVFPVNFSQEYLWNDKTYTLNGEVKTQKELEIFLLEYRSRLLVIKENYLAYVEKVRNGHPYQSTCVLPERHLSSPLIYFTYVLSEVPPRICDPGT